MQKQDGFQFGFYFWTSFADLPLGGLKKHMEK